jgi:hypothetical protein
MKKEVVIKFVVSKEWLVSRVPVPLLSLSPSPVMFRTQALSLCRPLQKPMGGIAVLTP